MAKRDYSPHILSLLAASLFFTFAAALATGELSLLGIFPLVLVLAAVQYLVIMLPAKFVVTKLKGDIANSPVWSFALWGAGIASIPWLLLSLLADGTSLSGSRFEFVLLALIAASGVVAGITFGRLLKEAGPTGCATCPPR